MAKIGINGFGRVGRMVLRACLNKCCDTRVCPLPFVVAINDPCMTADQMAYLLKYDTVYGVSKSDIKVLGKALLVDGMTVEVINETKPENIPWQKYSAEYIAECSGCFTTFEKAKKHLQAGAKCVIISTPCQEVPMFVLGVNHDCFESKMKVVSAASADTHCAAMLAMVLHESYDIKRGFFTSIMPALANAKCQDGPCLEWRRGRAFLDNIIPLLSKVNCSIGFVMPHLDGKLMGLEVRVPAGKPVGLIDFTVEFNKQVSFHDLKCVLMEASLKGMSGLLTFTNEQLTSSDFLSNTSSCIYDTEASMMLDPYFFKLLAWFDSETAYAYRIVDLIKYMWSGTT